jgi:hypothetical protein
LAPEFPPFMFDVFEVVDSSAESSKYVSTRNEQELKAPTQNRANQTVRFGKLDDLVSSGPTVVKGTVGSDEGVLLPAKWCLTRGRDKMHDNSRSYGGG